ncbi:MAG: hypothetical protein WCY56_05015, partial [Aminobacteriaceae bacterium]
KVIQECSGLGKSEGKPRMEGRYMRIMMTPLPQTQVKPEAKQNGKVDSQKSANSSAKKKEEALPVMAASQVPSE